MLDRIFKSEDGPGPVEYAVMLAILIALGLGFLGTSPSGSVTSAGSANVTTKKSVQQPTVKVGQVQESSKSVQ